MSDEIGSSSPVYTSDGTDIEHYDCGLPECTGHPYPHGRCTIQLPGLLGISEGE